MEREMLSSRLKDKKGTVSVSVALLLIFLIGFAAFAIDVGYMMVRRNELQNIADTAALAGAGQLYTEYRTMTTSDPLLSMPDPGPLLAKAQEVASGTGVSGVTISLADFRLGVWNPATHRFTPQAMGPTAVNVNARKDNIENDPFSTLLAGILGIRAFNVSATATASLTPPLSIDKLPIPVGISYAWYDHDWGTEGYCNQPIRFYPTGGGTDDITGCAGWHNYTSDRHDTHSIRTTLDQLINNSFEYPETIAGQTQFNFIGGNASTLFTNDKFGSLLTLFNANKVADTDGRCAEALASPEYAQYGIPYGGSSWTTFVPVYAPVAPTLSQSLEEANCSNPTGDMLVVGFSTVTICTVAGPPQYSTKLILAIVDCNKMASSTGGGPVPTGTWGTPNLVQ